jgi:hypothetical protein
MTRLEELAEKYDPTYHETHGTKIYAFTLDQLRELIKEFADEPVAWSRLGEVISNDGKKYAQGFLEPLYKLEIDK